MGRGTGSSGLLGSHPTLSLGRKPSYCQSRVGDQSDFYKWEGKTIDELPPKAVINCSVF